MTELQTVSDKQLIPGLSLASMRRLRSVRKWLYGNARPPDNRWEYRLVPSIITKSESLIFGTVSSQFAVRVYLDRQRTCFVNMRSTAVESGLRELVTRATASAGRISHFLGFDGRLDRNTKETRGFLADSLLNSPELSQSYHIVQSDLGDLFDEERELYGTPYVDSPSFAGGCAQAVCFMATALLSSHARGVYGMAEVTALANDPSSELRLGGLTIAELINYFAHPSVNLTATGQSVSLRRSPQESFAQALRSYLLSGMPVIVSLDLGRMRGLGTPQCPVLMESIYDGNGIRPLKASASNDSVRPMYHAALVVGCGREARSEEFLLNDPNGFPFLRATAAQLAAASWYSSDMTSVMPPVFLPVTPALVRVPLFNHRIESDRGLKTRGLGLVDWSNVFRLFGFSKFKTLPHPSSPDYQFRLCRLSQLSDVDAVLPAEKVMTEHLVSVIMDNGWKAERWCWLAKDKHACLVWDAEKELPSKAEPDFAETSLLGAMILHADGWELAHCESWARPKAVAGEGVILDTDAENRFGALSGVDSSGQGLSGRLFDETGTDANKVLLTSSVDVSASASPRRMANLSRQPAVIRQAACELCKELRDTPFCTTLSVSWAGMLNDTMCARDVVLFLIRLANDMKAYGQPVNAIRITGLSVVLGPGPRTEGDVQILNKMSRKEAIARLLGIIERPALEAKAHGLHIEIQTEESPLQAFGDVGGLIELCTAIESFMPADAAAVVQVATSGKHLAGTQELAAHAVLRRHVLPPTQFQRLRMRLIPSAGPFRNVLVLVHGVASAAPRIPQPPFLQHILVCDTDGRLQFWPVSVLGDYIQKSDSGIMVPNRALLTDFQNQFGIYTQEEITWLTDLLNNPKASEDDFQRFFATHKHFLTAFWRYMEVVPHVFLTRTKEGPLVPDFILTNKALQKAAIVELKLPNPKFIRRQTNRDRFANGVVEARTQLLRYRDWFREETNRRQLRRVVGMEIYEPQLGVIIGRSSEFTDDFDRQRLRADNPDIEVATYDDILEFARTRPKTSVFEEVSRGAGASDDFLSRAVANRIVRTHQRHESGSALRRHGRYAMPTAFLTTPPALKTPRKPQVRPAHYVKQMWRNRCQVRSNSPTHGVQPNSR